MPTTLTGLLLFAALLCRVSLTWSARSARAPSDVLHRSDETVAVVAASITSQLFVVVVSQPLWSRALDVDMLIDEPAAYWRQRPGLLAAWCLSLLAASTGVAFVATRPWLSRWIPSSYPHPSAVFGWWMLFDAWKLGSDIHIGCILDDGSYVAGWLASFNNSADDGPDRDL